MRTGDEGGAGRRVRIDVRAQLAAWSLGLTSGMGVNLLSDDLAYRGVAASAAVWAVIMATTWLRRLPPRAPLPRYTPPSLLTLALVPAALTLVGPRTWAGPATLTAAGLVAVAVLIPTTLETAGSLLFGAAVIGLGVAFIGVGRARLRDNDPLVGVAFIGLGVALVGIVVASLRNNDILVGASLVGAGAAVVGLGVAELRDNELLASAALIGLGVALIGFGVAGPVRHDDLLASAALIGRGAALAGAGAAVVGLGLAELRDNELLASAALIGLGVPFIGFGVALLRAGGVGRWVRAWWTGLTREPASASEEQASSADGGDRSS